MPPAVERSLIFYEGGAAGELLEPLNPDIARDCGFMPYRSTAHYRLALAVEQAARAVVDVHLGRSQVDMMATAVTPRSTTLRLIATQG